MNQTEVKEEVKEVVSQIVTTENLMDAALESVDLSNVDLTEVVKEGHRLSFVMNPNLQIHLKKGEIEIPDKLNNAKALYKALLPLLDITEVAMATTVEGKHYGKAVVEYKGAVFGSIILFEVDKSLSIEDLNKYLATTLKEAKGLILSGPSWDAASAAELAKELGVTFN